MLACLIRTVLVNTVQQTSSNLKELVRYEAPLVEKAAKNHLFCLSQLHVSTQGPYTSPMRSFYILCSNQPIANIQKHRLVETIKHLKTPEEALSLAVDFAPTGTEQDLSGLSKLPGVRLVEFSQNFYFEKFRKIDVADQEKSFFSLRLFAFVDLGEETRIAKIPFRQQVSARYVTLVPVQTLDHKSLH